MNIIQVTDGRQWVETITKTMATPYTFNEWLKECGYKSSVITLSDTIFGRLSGPNKLSKHITKTSAADESIILLAYSQAMANIATMSMMMSKGYDIRLLTCLPSPTLLTRRDKEWLDHSSSIIFDNTAENTTLQELGVSSKMRIVAPAAYKQQKTAKESPVINLLAMNGALHQLDLRKEIEAFYELQQAFGDNIKLTVIGTWSGRIAMPVIRETRRLSLEKNICWAGNPGNVIQLLDDADIALVVNTADKGPDSELSALLSASEIPIATTVAEIKQILSTEKSLKEAKQNAYTLWRENYQPQQRNESLISIINSTK